MVEILKNLLISLSAITASLTPIGSTKAPVSVGADPQPQVCINQYDYKSDVVEGSNITSSATNDILTRYISDPNYTGNVILNIYKTPQGRGYQIISKTSPKPAPILSDVATSTP